MIADLHVHFDEGQADPALVLRVAGARGIKALACVSHDSPRVAASVIKGFSSSGLLLIPAVEVWTRDGHLLALGAQGEVPSNLPLQETVELVHGLGGLAVASHPYVPLMGVGDRVAAARVDALEVNGLAGMLLFPNLLARLRARRYGYPLVGGSDAHTPLDVGSCYTEMDDASTVEDILSQVESGRIRVGARMAEKGLKTRRLVSTLYNALREPPFTHQAAGGPSN